MDDGSDHGSDGSDGRFGMVDGSDHGSDGDDDGPPPGWIQWQRRGGPRRPRGWRKLCEEYEMAQLKKNATLVIWLVIYWIVWIMSIALMARHIMSKLINLN